jgi:cephalosporin-C deacetylase
MRDPGRSWCTPTATTRRARASSGIGRGPASTSPVWTSAASWGYVLTGIEAPERSVLRGAVCDLVRTAQVAHDMLGRKVSRVVLNGMSFGGALAVMAAAVGHQPNLLAVGVPTLGWAEGRNLLVRQGSGAEISRFAERRPESREDAMVTLRYFDAVNFADLIRAPTLVGVGLVDPVVPPSTVYAIANHLAGPREVMELPVSHTDRPEESEWKRFERRWIALALEEKELSLGGRIAWTS